LALAAVAQAIVRGCERLRERGWAAISFPYDDTRDGQHVDLIALARGAGLGAASRLGLLLHPEYGPWLSLRALVLTEKPPPESPPRRDFSPCEGCSAPCTDACPVDAPRALPAGFDISACTNRRALGGSCQLHCAARRACIFGSEHAYDLDTEERHMRASLSHIRPGVE
jgi:epoxyqueuosine reductase QueG